MLTPVFFLSSSQMLKPIKSIMLNTLVSTSLTLCLYICLPTFYFVNLSKMQKIKFVSIFLFVNMQLYYNCSCSEQLNDCNIQLCCVVSESLWYKCCAATRRDVSMMLRCAQRTNYVMMAQGSVTICYEYMVKVAKMTFSVFNFLTVTTT